MRRQPGLVERLLVSVGGYRELRRALLRPTAENGGGEVVIISKKKRLQGASGGGKRKK